MRDVGAWKRSLKELSKDFNSFQELTIVHRLSDDLMERIELEMETTRNAVNDMITAVEKEDKERNIRTLDSTRAEQRKFKKFSGVPGEDFLYFKKDFEEAVIANRISRSNQLEKLRENLTGEAFKQVPKNMTGGLEAAWQSLKVMFGDPERLLNFRMKALDALGKFPPSMINGQPNYAAQATWLAPFLVELSEIISLGETHQELQNTVFNSSTINNVINRFAEKDDLGMLVMIVGRDREKLITMKAKLETLKARTVQFSARTTSEPSPKFTKDPHKKNGGQNATAASLGEVRGMTVFKHPERFGECRICDLFVNEQRPPAQVYERHLSDWVTGCPIFMALATVDKFRKGREAEFCVQCFDKSVKFVGGSHLNKETNQAVQCMVTKNSKHRYSCLDKECLNHMWICRKHKKLNEPTMKKQQARIKNSGGSLNFVADIIAPSTKQTAVASAMSPLAAVSEASLPEYVPTSLPDSIRNMPTHAEIGNALHVMQADQSSAKSKSSSILHNQKKSRKAKKKEVAARSNFIPVPKGAPIFMFQGVEGKTKSTKWFYDSGCSHICMKSSIPVTEYDSTLLQKGPFNIGGVGGLKVLASDEYLISVKREDGRMQHFQGVTMDTITTEFPEVNLEKATAEVLLSDPNNVALQKCSVPPSVGGEVDVLVGITYNSSFPELIHMLDCGLGIYRCRLASHDKRWNALLGGSHESFECLAEKSGNVSHLLANFVNGLKVFRTCGPPKLENCPMTIQEELYAKVLNARDTEVKDIKDLVTMEIAEQKIAECFGEDASKVTTKQLGQQSDNDKSPENSIITVTYCQDCSTVDLINSSTDMRSMTSEDRLWELRGVMKQLESSGLEVDYRCVRCRNCSQCRDAAMTDKISLREEQELQQCRDSVVLDKVNRKVRVSLPLRGPERDFLVSNRGSAEQTLEQQCKKYASDSDTKASILKAFKKMMDPGFLVFLEDLDEETKLEFINKEIQYFIPWRIQFKESVSTPERPVFDASTKTKKRSDGSGGRCLNDLVCKGVVNNINMIKLLLRFSIGLFALCGDIKQWYNSGKLVPSQWNLQRFLFKEDLDADSETKEGVITTLIYGVKSSSCQTEITKEKLADSVEEDKPGVAEFLRDGFYVDDGGDSKAKKEDLLKLMSDTDEALASIGCEIKDWVLSGEDPSDKVSKDGVSLEVGGMIWYPKLDIISVKIPVLHFGKIIRGKVKPGTKFFQGGGVKDLDEFFPGKFTKRQATSKYASIYDPRQKLCPMLAVAKLLLSKTNKQTVGWDDPMPAILRNKWVDLFWRFEQLRGLKFSRPIMPVDAKDTKMRLLVGADAAEPMIIIGAWGSFEKTDGSFSCQHLLGRNLLADDTTIPKLELAGLCGASNMKCIVKRALGDWVHSEIVFGDSVIALCWTTSENRRLGIFHRTRVLQIRRFTPLEQLYHVKTDHNPCDTGTRPEKVTLESVGPESKWERGADWMSDSLEEAVSGEIIKPAMSLRLKPEEEKEFNDGCIFEKPEILTRGHVTMPARVSKLEARATFSNYPLLPTKFAFPVVVRIYATIIKFVTNCSKNRKILRHLLSEANFQFSVFNSYTTDDLQVGDVPQPGVVLGDQQLSAALTFLYQKASMEVKEFNSQSVIKKYTVEKNNILYSKGRLIDGMNFIEAGGLDLGDLGELGVNVQVPVLDRYSPLSYSIANHVHWKLAKHKGMETCSRTSLQNVHILQGPALYREIGEECIKCKMKRKHFLEVSMGPVSQHQLAVAPPMWAAQVDLFGPCTVYVPGYERETRARKALATEVHVMVFACPVTRIVNLQVIEGKDTGCILEGVTRLSCEIGIPKYLLIDGDDAQKKAFNELEVNIRDLKYQLHKEKGIVFDVCPVSGHNQHGQVERVIKSVQESLDDCGVKNLRLHATGLQTFLKLVENTYNNAPYGFSHGRDADNGSILKTISPNMMRVGRNNERSLEGNFRLPAGGYEMVDKVDKLYKAWYSLWKDAVVPKLIRQPKWFKTDKHLKPGDMVYYERDPSKLGSVWVMGRVDQVIRSSDGLIREAVVVYRNHKESFNRLTTRAVRSLVRIFSVDEDCIQEDLAELQKRIDRLNQLEGDGHDDVRAGLVDLQQVLQQVDLNVAKSSILYQVLMTNTGDTALGETVELVPLSQEQAVLEGIPTMNKCCRKCCCLSHCRLSNHHTVIWKKAKEFTNPFVMSTMLYVEDEAMEEFSIEEEQLNFSDEKMMEDSLTDLLMNVNGDVSKCL